MVENNNPVQIRKASGELQPFDLSKLKNSLMRTGANDQVIDSIAQNISEWIHEGVNTNMIYSRAHSLLRKQKTKASFHYKLKQAILEFGTTGYPFEQLIGQIFAAEGYNVEVGVVVKGQCINHEIDVIATRGSEQHLVECKYSKSRDKQISVQTPLYVHSRMQDVMAQRSKLPEYTGFQFTGWVVSNIRFTLDSIDFSKCAGLNLMSWNYPHEHGLKERIEKANILPITLLNYLKSSDKKYLIDKGIVVCNQLLENFTIVDELNLTHSKKESLLQELRVVVSTMD